MPCPYFSRSGHEVVAEPCLWLWQAGGKLLPGRAAGSARRGAGAVPARHRLWRALVNVCRGLDAAQGVLRGGAGQRQGDGWGQKSSREPFISDSALGSLAALPA